MPHRTEYKRRYKPSPYDRIQDRKIRKLMIVEEKKFHDATISENHLAAATSWDTVAITSPAQGDTQSTRDGDEILVESIFLRVRISANGTAAETRGMSIRLCIWSIKKSNPGAEEQGLDLFTTNDIHGLNRIDGDSTSANVPPVAGNIQFYHDKIYNFNINASDREVKIYIKFKGAGLKQTFGANARAIINPLAWGFAKLAGADQWNIIGNIRTRFTG